MKSPVPVAPPSTETRGLRVLLLVGLGLVPVTWMEAGDLYNRFAPSPALICKYSVRDVGFVNVHSFTWQLTLVKPVNLSSEKFRVIDEEVRRQLDRANVHHLWTEKNSAEWKEIMENALRGSTGQRPTKSDPSVVNNSARNPTTNQTVWGVLSNTNGEYFLCEDSSSSVGNIEELGSSLRSLIDSPFRSKILEACSETLCCIVLVESGNRERDKNANQLLRSAVTQLQKQMWELEKPTARPAMALVLKYEQQTAEKWFLQTSGLANVTMGGDKNDNQPKFAVFYGQGRRLGEWIPMTKTDVTQLVGRAAICGGDCECDLDRDWLYGHQILHRWQEDLENNALSTLNFDPFAAYVKSEVAAIVRKAGRETSPGNSIDLGPGLIIHDLDSIEARRKTVEKPLAVAAEQGPDAKSQRPVGASSTDKNSSAALPQTRLNKSTEPDSDQPATIRLPFSLMAVLLVAAGLTVIWAVSKGRN